VKRNRKGSKQRRQTIQVWTYDQARQVLPYVESIMRSLRERQLEAQEHHLSASRLADKPGRPDRATLVAREETLGAAHEAEARVHEALEELHTLDIYCLDPVQGLALIPFAQENQLAWYIFDLFDGDFLRYWRFHRDPLEMRRPIADVLPGPQNSVVI
jgi:Uncharacterized conserved protein (DUF2203)